MAKNTKGDGSLEQNGSTVVTPDNIGQGIKWNPATNKYDVQIAQNQPIVINDNGELEVRVSKLENNQLRLMKDGLYYGNQARTELANLYVDAVNGVDQDPLKVQGAGTRAKPLKTLLYAISLLEYGASHRIYLYEGQTHIWNQYKSLNSQLSLRPYGSRLDYYISISTSNSQAYDRLDANENLLPIIEFQGANFWRNPNSTDDNVDLRVCIVERSGSLYLDGVSLCQNLDIDFTRPNDTTKLNISFPMRIKVDSSFYFTRGRLLVKGKPKYTALIPESSVVLNGINQLGFAYSTEGTITYYSMYNDANIDVYYFTPSGWYSVPTASCSVNTVNEAIAKAMAKRMGSLRKQNFAGETWVTAPSVNFSQEYFK